MTVVKVLLVEDDAGGAQITSDMLDLPRAPHCELTRVTCLAEALALLGERFHVILLDLGLPDVGGVDGVRALRAGAPDAAIIVFGGIGSEAIAVEALEAGAQDYLVEGGSDEDALHRSIRLALARREADVAQRRLAAIVESCQDAIVTSDLAATITSWNGAAERLYGYTRAEAVGSPASMLVGPERDGEEGDIRARGLLGEPAAPFETTRVCKDGTLRHVSLAVAAIHDGDGTVTGLSSVARDITLSTRAAESLRAAEERFRIAFEEAPIGMALVSLDRRFIRVNAALAELVGYDAADLEGRDTSFIDDPEDPLIDLAAVRSFLEDQTSYLPSDRRYQHAAGHSVWVTLNITCVRRADGRPLHYLAQMQDITERRRHEAQLQHMADHDPLTGLPNRRAFERELRAQVARAERYGAGAALMIDLDLFKAYNDRHGHQAGDRLIVRVAGALRKRLRKSDVLARLGGDEFAVILPSAGEDGTRRLVGELCDCVRGEGLTASIGVAFFDATTGLPPEDIMLAADQSMYEAKNAGGDRGSFDCESPPPQAPRRRVRATGP